MEQNQFNYVLQIRLEKTQKTLAAKADEYARGDRLSNFKKMADMMDCSNERALLGLVMKHIVALTDFVNDIQQGKRQPYERWDEKIGDIMAYMILLDAIVQEKL